MSSRWRSRREPKVWLDWAQPDDPPCSRGVGDDRPGSSAYELEHLAGAPIQVYPLLETALAQRQRERRGASGARERALGALRGGRGRQSARVVARGLLRRRDPDRRSGQSDGDVPLSEAHVRQHGRRPGRGRRCMCSYEAAQRGRHRRRPHGVPTRRRRRARPVVLLRARSARHLSGDPCRRPARPSMPPGSASTTSRASTSTRAFPPRCRSRWVRSSSAGRRRATLAR